MKKKSLFHGCERDFFSLTEKQMMESSRTAVQESARSSSTPRAAQKSIRDYKRWDCDVHASAAMDFVQTF